MAGEILIQESIKHHQAVPPISEVLVPPIRLSQGK